MKCPKCGFVGSDHVSACAKCGKDLDAVRRELNLLDFTPVVPAFILEAILAASHKAARGSAATAAALAASAGESDVSLDLLGEIDLKVDLDEKPEEITLELLDEGEEPPEEPEPTVVAAPEGLALDGLSTGDAAVVEPEPPSGEAWAEPLDLKIHGDEEGMEEPGVFDLSDVEDDAELAQSLDEEAMSDEALERLRRELESADGILKDMEKEGLEVEEAPAEPAAGVLEREPAEEVFILMEEREGGLAVQEFSLEEPAPEQPVREEPQEAFVLDLDALEEEEPPKPAQGAAPEKEAPAVDGLILELEDGFYIEPDEEER